MKALVLVSFLHLFLLSSCQTNQPENETENKVVFHDNEKLPEFKEGLDSLNSWMKKEMKLPSSITDEGMKKEVIIRFFIDSLGGVSDVSILKSSSSKEYDNEILRIVKSMPKWEKGTIGAYFNLPIIFQGNESK